MAELLVDIDKIAANTEAVATLLRDQGLSLVAVTKGCRGEPRVAAAMIEAGATALGDSRDADLRRLRETLPGVELHRITLPPSTEDFALGDLNYISSWKHAEAVAEARGASAGPLRVMLLLETGDEREGAPVDQAMGLAERIDADPRLELAGIATNYACLRGTPEGIEDFGGSGSPGGARVA